MEVNMLSSRVLIGLRYMGPLLSKRSFPVSRMGQKKSQSGGRNLFFFSNFIFYKLECTGGKSEKKNWKIGKKKFQ